MPPATTTTTIQTTETPPADGSTRDRQPGANKEKTMNGLDEQLQKKLDAENKYRAVPRDIQPMGDGRTPQIATSGYINTDIGTAYGIASNQLRDGATLTREPLRTRLERLTRDSAEVMTKRHRLLQLLSMHPEFELYREFDELMRSELLK